MSNTYVDVIITLTNLVDSSRFFSPIISWLIVSYVYFAIGVCSGNSLWKHLYLVCTYGLIANLLYAIEEVSEGLDKEQFKHVFRYFKYPESFFFACNEWGLVYINFIKIRSCIKTLKSKFWKILINILFIYVICCHLLNTHIKLMKGDISKKINIFLYSPIIILEFYFVFSILYISIHKNFDKSRKAKDIIIILLKSNISRMFIVSLILLCISVVECINTESGYSLIIKRLFLRFKDSIGIIYLIELLLTRIDSDSNTIKKHEVKLLKYCVKEKSNELNEDKKGTSDIFGFDPDDPYGLNKNPMDYIKPSNSSFNSYKNSPVSDYSNNESIFKTTPISEYNREPSSFIPKQTNTPMVSNIATSYLNGVYPSTSYSNKNNRNGYKNSSFNYSIKNKNNNNNNNNNDSY